MKLAHCVLPLLLWAAVPVSADTLTDFFPPDTRVVFGIRVHNLGLSAVAQSFKAQAQSAGMEWLKLPLAGFDLLRDVDEVMIAATGTGQNPPAIIVVTGRFDAARLAEGAGKYHDVPILGSPREGESLVALVDASTMLIGSADLVHKAIDQRGGKHAINAGLNDRITSLRQRYDVWGLGEQPDGFHLPFGEGKGLDSLDRFQFGMQVVNGLELGAEIHARTPDDIEKLKAVLADLADSLRTRGGENSALRFDVEAEGATLKLTVAMPEAELK